MLQGQHLILLVEDREDDVVLTLRAFKQNKLKNEIVVARDGQEALDYLFGQGKHAGRDLRVMPNLILLDLKLPKVDGIEVLKQIRVDKRTRGLPVVVLTSSKEEQDLVQCYNSHVNSYIRKPVNFEQFTQVVQQLGLYWLLINETPSASNP